MPADIEKPVLSPSWVAPAGMSQGLSDLPEERARGTIPDRDGTCQRWTGTLGWNCGNGGNGGLGLGFGGGIGNGFQCYMKRAARVTNLGGICRDVHSA
jgi:hypothetical protein